MTTTDIDTTPRTFVQAVYADIAKREARDDAMPSTLRPIVRPF